MFGGGGSGGLFLEIGSHYVALVGLKLKRSLTSASASSAGIKGAHNQAWFIVSDVKLLSHLSSPRNLYFQIMKVN